MQSYCYDTRLLGSDAAISNPLAEVEHLICIPEKLGQLSLTTTNLFRGRHMESPLAPKANFANSRAITCQHSILDNLSTAEFAAALRQKAESLRSELCRTGSVKGVKPIKLTSNKGGRLLWPRRDVEALLLKLGGTPFPSPDKVEGVKELSSNISFSSVLQKENIDRPSTPSTMEGNASNSEGEKA